MLSIKLYPWMTLSALVCAYDAPLGGHEKCPCLEGPFDLDNLSISAQVQDNLYANFVNENIVGTNLSSTFGVGCKAHSDEIGYCEFLDELCAVSDPKPKECEDVGWCKNQFCFIETKNCTLAHRTSPFFRFLDYSFATCGHMDFFVEAGRFEALKGKTLKVAYTANTGGYLGAYNVNGSFALNDGWSGPAVDFVAKVANSSDFNIEMVAPPDFLIEQATEFFNSSDDFDFCSYAAALGYVDLCVGSFTFSTKRIVSAKWFKLGKDPINLINFASEEKSWIDEFFDDATLLLTPFSPNVWYLLFLFVIPFMSLLMFNNEYGVEGGAFPHKDKGNILGYVGQSLYDVLLSLFAGYGQEVVSRSGKVHLLGIGFFNMVVLAVYTANLAAILSSNNNNSSPTTLKAVRNNQMKICATRLDADLVAFTQPIITDLLLKDPVDGLPGFVSVPIRGILDQMKSNVEPSERDLFCEVAIMGEADFLSLQGNSVHCNKTADAKILTFSTTGFPISPLYNEVLWSLFQRSVNEGVLDRIIAKHKPDNQCPALQVSSKNGELLVTHLAGVWAVPIICAIIGFIIHKTDKRKSSKERTHPCHTQGTQRDMESVPPSQTIQ